MIDLTIRGVYVSIVGSNYSISQWFMTISNTTTSQEMYWILPNKIVEFKSKFMKKRR